MTEAEEYRKLLEEKHQRFKLNEWRTNPMVWLEERFGENPRDYKWSDWPGFPEGHKWDGDKDPLYESWMGLARNNWVGIESGTGCHAKGQGLIMYDGSIKKVEDIIVGDLLMGDDSTPREVLELYRGRETMAKVTPVKGESFVVNKSHILSLALTGGHKHKHRAYPLIENVSVTNYLQWSKTKKHHYKLYRTGVSFQRSRTIKYDPYFIGLWLGDGTTSGTGITNIDKEIIDYIYSYAKDIGGSVTINDGGGKRTPTYKINYRSKEPKIKRTYAYQQSRKGKPIGTVNPLKNYLKRFVKNGEKFIPTALLVSSYKERCELLAGLIDSDGHKDKIGLGYEFCTIYKVLADGVLFLARSLGLGCTISYRENEFKGSYRISISGDATHIPMKVERKKAYPRQQIKDVLKTGFSIEELLEADYYGFELSGNHLYLLDDFTVTHNTGKTFLLSRVVLWFLDCWEDSLVVTSAPKQDQLKLHLWSEITKIFHKFKKIRPYAELLQLRLKVDSRQPDNSEDPDLSSSWQAVGFIAGAGAEEQSATRAQGFHRKDMLIIIEETPGMPTQIMTALKNTSIGDHNLMFALGNPDSVLDELHRFATMREVGKFKVEKYRASGFDHPNVTMGKDIVPGAVTRKSIAMRESDYGKDSPMYMSRVRGISPAQGADSLIKLEWIEQCIYNKDFVNDGHNAAGVDVANSEAGDTAAIAWGLGSKLVNIDEFYCANATHLAYNMIYDNTYIDNSGFNNYNTKKVHEYIIGASCIGVDAVGIGVATVNAFLESGYRVMALQGGQWEEAIPLDDNEKPMYKFVSLRAQMYWALREALRKKEISIELEDNFVLEKLKKQLITPKFDNSRATVAVERKELIKKRLGGESPALADAVAYWNWMRMGYRISSGFMNISGGK